MVMLKAATVMLLTSLLVGGILLLVGGIFRTLLVGWNV
jgi:hypothetical protein